MKNTLISTLGGVTSIALGAVLGTALLVAPVKAEAACGFNDCSDTVDYINTCCYEVIGTCYHHNWGYCPGVNGKRYSGAVLYVDCAPSGGYCLGSPEDPNTH